MRNKIFILIFILIFLSRVVSASSIYYEGKISPYRILQKVTSSFYDIESVEIIVESWFQNPLFHMKAKFNNIFDSLDDYKVEGRVSMSSLIPDTKFSTSSWVQSYNVRGVPFSWLSKDEEWENKALDIEEQRTRKALKYSLLSSLFFVKEETVDPSTLQFLGEAKKDGKECFVVKFNLEKDAFKQWNLMGRVTNKIWVDKETFLPLASRVEGKLGDMNILQIVIYKNYNAQLEFSPHSFILDEVEKEKALLEEKIKILVKDVAQIRDWPLLEDVKVEFARRSRIRDVIIEELEDEYSDEQIIREGRILKWLNLIPQEASYKELIINSQTSLIAGLYDPKRKTIFIGDWLEPAIAEVVSAHEIAHALQDKMINLEGFLKQAGDSLDLKFALQSLVEGEAFAVGLEYLLRKDEESFKEWEDLSSLIEERALKGSFLRDRVFYSIYGYGAKFIQACLNKYEWSKLGRIYDDLPTSMVEIMHPTKYLVRMDVVKEEKKIRKKELLELVEPEGWKKIYATSLGEYFLFLSLDSILDRSISEEASLGWMRDKLIIYDNEKGDDIFLFLTQWDSKEDAVEFLKSYSKYLDGRGFRPMEEKVKDALPSAEAAGGLSDESNNIIETAGDKDKNDDNNLTKYSFISSDSKEKTIFKLVDDYIIIVWTDKLGENDLDLVAEHFFSQLGESKKA